MRHVDALPAAAELERRVADQMRHWRVPATEVRVAWNPQLTTTAGRAFPRQGRIELNPHLLERAPEQLQTVLIHEAAHVAAQRLFGERVGAHGRHWRALMRLAGLPPDVTHAIPTRGIRRLRFAWVRFCDACGDRRLGKSVRYDVCRCGAADQFLVLKAPRTEHGLSALRKITLEEARIRCGGDGV
jgi:predicted SprT family Zn-dependent metalloprotease